MKSKLFYNISLYLLSALFLFSGFAKGINPFGLSVQFGDYFSAMGLGFLRPISTICAVTLPAAEIFIGLMLASGVFHRFFAWVTAVFMGFFTLLTLWIAIFNPVKDCGCFGDLLVISNWATFFKNIFFDIFVVVLFIGRNRPQKQQWPLMVGLASLSFLLPIYSYNNLPLIDATPYKIGVNIPDAMAGTRYGEAHTVLIYKNLASGEIKKFEISDTTWQNAAVWEYVDSQTTEIDGGYTAPIKSFSLFNENGLDLAPAVLSAHRAVLFIVARPSKLSDEQRQHLSNAAAAATAAGDSVYLLHSELNTPQIANLKPLGADQTMLQTMAQHHLGGVMILDKGTIVQKYPLSGTINFGNQK